MVCVDDILTATGKSSAGREGGSLKVLDVGKDTSGRLTLRVELDTSSDLSVPVTTPGVPVRVGRPLRGGPIPVGGVVPPPAAPVAGANPVPGARSVGGLHLLDDKGDIIRATGMLLNVRRGAAGIVREYTLEFSLPAGREPSKLVYEARKAVGVEVPFVLKDVPLQ
jgi:hypothetical protein